MTGNQIAYQNSLIRQDELAETTRSHKAVERETAKHNRKTERQAQMSLREQVRSNKANESIGRRNATSNRITALANKRNAKSNAVNARANTRNAATNARNAEINAYNAQTNARNAATNERNATTAERKISIDKRTLRSREKIAHNQNLTSIRTKKLENAGKIVTAIKSAQAQSINDSHRAGLDRKTYQHKTLADMTRDINKISSQGASDVMKMVLSGMLSSILGG